MESIFIKNYKSLHTYASNLMYRMPWLLGKGYKAEDIVHDTYLSYMRYKDKFKDYEEKKLEQVLKNLLYWTMQDLNRSMRESNVEDFMLDVSHNSSLVESKLFNQELSKVINALDKTEADMFNMRLAGYTYKEINKKFNVSNSQTLLDNSMSKISNKLNMDAGMISNDVLVPYIRNFVSISEIARKTGISPYLVKKQVKGLLGEKYRTYSKETQKKKKGGC